jgi:acyl dehydratase
MVMPRSLNCARMPLWLDSSMEKSSGARGRGGSMSQDPGTDPKIQSLFGIDKVEIYQSPAPVSEWPILAWCRAMGDENPVYRDRNAARSHGHEDVFAPPVMMYSFTMPGLFAETQHGLLSTLRRGLSKHGFDSVLAVNYEQEFITPVRLGDRLRREARFESMSERKTTSVGAGYFVVLADRIVNQKGEWVGNQKMRTLFFRPGPADETHQSAASRNCAASHKALEPGPASATRVELPPLAIPVTTTLVIAAALATNDFEKIHHDRDLARSHGLSDISMNVLTWCGLAIRYVTDWAGPAARIRRISTQLKAPTYPGDTLTLSGWTESSFERGIATQVHVRGANSLGAHIDSVITIA